MIDKDRVFYANTFQVAVSETEAVLVFKLRDLVTVLDPNEDPKKVLAEATEIARIHIPRALMDVLMADMVRRHQQAVQLEKEKADASS